MREYANELPVGEKPCKICTQILPLSAFDICDKFLGKAKKYYRFYKSYCRPCEVERVRKRKLVRVYGISVDEFEEMKRKQGLLCYLCSKAIKESGKKADRICIDHDHKTGKVRALLCFKCNVGLAMFDENSEVMVKAAAYVKGEF